MALMSCPDCGGQLSTQASICPHCGCPATFNETQAIDLTTTQDFGPCPELPADLSIGSQVVNWWGDAAFDGYYNSEENAMPNYASGKVHVILHKKGISVTARMYQSFLKIHNEQIINSQAVKRTALIQESNSVVGRAVVGGLILGPVGAIVGGLTGLSPAPTVYDGYLVVNYWDSAARTPRTLLVAGPLRKIDKFCSHLSELRNKKPPAKKYKVKIKGPDDNKKMYRATKAFYEDAGVTFEKAKAFLEKGVVMTFEDKDFALQFIEKYNQMECKAELVDERKVEGAAL